MAARSIPVTTLTRHYLALKESPSAKRLEEARSMSAVELAREFNESAEAFRGFTADGQRFYDDDPDRRDADKNEKSNARTYGWAMDMHGTGRVAVDGGAELDFVYLDREIVPTRTKPALPYDGEDGASLRIDLVLVNALTGRPIVGELKIASDKDPYSGLVQALAATAQMTTASQRQRLVTHSEREGLHRRLPLPLADFDKEPKMDIYVLLAEFPKRGRHRFAQLERAAELAGELEAGSMLDGVGHIRVLVVSKSTDGAVTASSELPRQG
jgi:hypothetical protein